MECRGRRAGLSPRSAIGEVGGRSSLPMPTQSVLVCRPRQPLRVATVAEPPRPDSVKPPQTRISEHVCRCPCVGTFSRATEGPCQTAMQDARAKPRRPATAARRTGKDMPAASAPCVRARGVRVRVEVGRCGSAKLVAPWDKAHPFRQRCISRVYAASAVNVRMHFHRLGEGARQRIYVRRTVESIRPSQTALCWQQRWMASQRAVPHRIFAC